MLPLIRRNRSRMERPETGDGAPLLVTQILQRPQMPRPVQLRWVQNPR